MRLLKKEQIDTAKALDRQREIEQGKALAGKVDGLRELYAQEEASLYAFRVRSVEELHREIDPLCAEKEALVSDIRELTHERNLLMVPLTAKWEEVGRREVRVGEEQEKLAVKKLELVQAIQALDNFSRELAGDKERIAEQRTTANELTASSGKIHAEAREELADARNQAQIIVYEADELRRQTANLLEAVIVRERDVNIQEQITQAHEVELGKRERALTDKYATLQRTMKRLHD